MSGRVGDLSDTQAEKLAQFKEALTDIRQEEIHDDIYLLRFLRARQFDLKKAEDMFRKDLEWRQKNDVATLVKEYVPPEVVTKYFGGDIIGHNKDGSVVFLDPVGKRDVKGLMYSCKSSDLVKSFLQMMERYTMELVAQNKKFGKDVGGIVYVTDLEGLGASYFWKPWQDLSNKMLGHMEKHYPEIMKQMIIINVPKVFYILYAISKPLMQEGTRRKLVILGGNWKTEIVKYVDADILPAHWGGNRVDPDGDPMCPSVITMAGPIPKSYYLKDQAISDNILTTREVARAATLEFKYEVARPGSLLNYEFQTKSADIGFSVKKIGTDGKKREVIGKERYNCHISPEEGHVTLQEPGTYVVKFDNGYSLTRAKTLSYFVELLEPLGEDEETDFIEQEDIGDLSALE